MVAIGLVATVIGVALGLAIDWFPAEGSTEAFRIDEVYLVLLAISVAIFVGVLIVVVYSVIVFRMRPGEELKDGPPIHGNTRLEVIWTVLPAALVSALCVYAYTALTKIESPKADTLHVRVVGEQFTWTFYYKGKGGKEFASNQLFLPVDQHVHFTVQSKDVIHSFWVPAFRLKVDAVPGINTDYRITTRSKPAKFAVACAELCGLGHAMMRQTAHVVSRAEYQKWYAKQTKVGPAPPAPGGKIDAQAIFTSGATPACASCHTLKAAGATGTIGPNLDTGLKGKTKAYIKQSIVDPNAVVTPGYTAGIMPTTYPQSLSAKEIDALVNYLASVAGK
jgi:cytochrome c oxidase subunit 2